MKVRSKTLSPVRQKSFFTSLGGQLTPHPRPPKLTPVIAELAVSGLKSVLDLDVVIFAAPMIGDNYNSLRRELYEQNQPSVERY